MEKILEFRWVRFGKRTHREGVWGSFWVLPGCWAENEASFKGTETGFPLTLNLSPGGERRLRTRRASKHALVRNEPDFYEWENRG